METLYPDNTLPDNTLEQNLTSTEETLQTLVAHNVISGDKVPALKVATQGALIAQAIASGRKFR